MSIETILNEIKNCLSNPHDAYCAYYCYPPPSPPAPAQHCRVSCKLKEQVANTICNVKKL